MKRLLLILLSGCQAVDLLDGDIENRENCCLKITKEKIEACYASFLEPGDCANVTCSPLLPDIGICRWWDGQVCDIEEGCPDE